MPEPLQNWAGNYTYSAARVHRPASVPEVQELVARTPKLRALGTRHSFNAIADTPADLISTERLNQVLSVDRERLTVTVQGGTRYGDLALALHAAGYALHNMGSLPHISVAGACATGTHGSGDANGNLATAVVALEIVTADGALRQLAREQHGDAFDGMVVALGCLGVVTSLTLRIEPSYLVQQEVYEHLPVAELEANVDAIFSGAYSVSLFTDWRAARVNQVWLKRRVTERAILAPTLYGATLAAVQRHPIAELSGEPCTPQLGVPGPWHERLPHFRLDQTPSNGAEIQSEYFVPREHAVAALRAVAALQPQIAGALMISEIRTVQADALWLSPAYRRETVGIHFTWHLDAPAVERALPLVEAALAPFAPRPHWGKVFTLDPAAVRRSYPRLAEFQELARTFDPQSKFRNGFVERYLFPE